jgi:hypothetical protein
MAETSAQLDYAPRPPVLRRRWVRRAILAVFLLAVTAAGASWGPGVYRRASLLYWQRQCLGYAAPADQLVYESDPLAGSALRAADRHYQFIPTGWGAPRKPVATGYLPDCWTRFGKASPGFAIATQPVLFLHELKTRSGQPRLVAVAGAFNPTELPLFISGHDVQVLTIEPGTWKTLPQNRTGGIALSVLSGPQPQPPHLRIYAGQPDPADPSHFTIRYEVDGVEHIVDGWLRDGWPAGYDSVEFKVRG